MRLSLSKSRLKAALTEVFLADPVLREEVRHTLHQPGTADRAHPLRLPAIHLLHRYEGLLPRTMPMLYTYAAPLISKQRAKELWDHCIGLLEAPPERAGQGILDWYTAHSGDIRTLNTRLWVLGRVRDRRLVNLLVAMQRLLLLLAVANKTAPMLRGETLKVWDKRGRVYSVGAARVVAPTLMGPLTLHHHRSGGLQYLDLNLPQREVMCRLASVDSALLHQHPLTMPLIAMTSHAAAGSPDDVVLAAADTAARRERGARIK